MEGHGTSTSVGDAVELNSLMDAFSGAQAAPGSIALGSVKSNIGHLKAAAGAAGMIKATLALNDKLLPPSINFEQPNSNLDWSAVALRGQHRAARLGGGGGSHPRGRRQRVRLRRHQLPPRDGGVRAERYATNGDRSSAAGACRTAARQAAGAGGTGAQPPLRGALVIGADDEAGLVNALARSWRRRARGVISSRPHPARRR